jgi:hypothetical protein
MTITDEGIYGEIRNKAVKDSNFAIAYALLQVAYQIKYLGNGSAGSTMGALEYVGTKIEEAADALKAIGYAIENAGFGSGASGEEEETD